jgi:hypothetical protein
MKDDGSSRTGALVLIPTEHPRLMLKGVAAFDFEKPERLARTMR